MQELDDAFRENQLNYLPFVKSGRTESDLFGRHPELADILHRARRARLDAITLQAKIADPNLAFGRSMDLWEEDYYSTKPNKTDITEAPPVMDAYRPLTFGEGYVYSPPPNEPASV